MNEIKFRWSLSMIFFTDRVFDDGVDFHVWIVYD